MNEEAQSDAPAPPPANSTSAPAARSLLDRRLAAVAIGLFVLTRLGMLFLFTPDGSDVPYYFEYASRAVDARQTPYVDPKMQIEYPPIAWWVIELPRLLDPQPLFTHAGEKPSATQLKAIYRRYHFLFHVEMFLFDAAAFALLIAVLRRRQVAAAGVYLLGYVLTTTILAHLLYDRLDAGLLAFLMGWAYLWQRSLERGPRQDAWRMAAYLVFGLSISYKVIPLIVVPLLGLAELWEPRPFRAARQGLIALIVGVVAPYFMQYPVSGMNSLHWTKYHSERGVQIESIYASGLIVASHWGVLVQSEFSHGAYDLASPYSPIMKKVGTLTMLCFLFACGFWALAKWRRYNRGSALELSSFVLPASVILSNVVSPQYFIWAFPLTMLFAAQRWPRSTRAAWGVVLTLVVLCALTTWLFPYHYFVERNTVGGEKVLGIGLIPLPTRFSFWPCAVLVTRNAIYLLLLIVLGVALVKRKQTPAPEDQVDVRN